MGQVLHGCATTTEAVRRAIQNSQESLRALAKRSTFAPCNRFEFPWRQLLRPRKKSTTKWPRRDFHAGRGRSHASNRLCRKPLYGTGPLTPANTRENWLPRKIITHAISMCGSSCKRTFSNELWISRWPL
jgi:hypothetical protein